MSSFYIPSDPKKRRVQLVPPVGFEFGRHRAHTWVHVFDDEGRPMFDGEPIPWSFGNPVWDRLRRINQEFPLQSGEWDLLVSRDPDTAHIIIEPVPRSE